jgi:hypothetical protein
MLINAFTNAIEWFLSYTNRTHKNSGSLDTADLGSGVLHYRHTKSFTY